MTSVLEARALALDGRLRPTDIVLRPRELVALVGPNGGGKTSLLRALAGVEASAGSVIVDGSPTATIPPARRPSSFTFLPASRDMVWPIQVRDVIALGLPRPDPWRVESMLELLELQSLADRRADQLSTGERARVLVARALAPRPKALLLDEPLSNLDPYWVLRLLEILRAATEEGAAALVAVHDIERIQAFDRAILVQSGEIAADLEPRDMLASSALAEAFRIERKDGGWRVRRPADPQSSR